MFGQVLGAVIGGMATKSAAKTDAKAQRYAADKSAEGYTDARPFINDMYRGGQNALNAALNTGAYTDTTLAPMDPRTASGLNYLANFGTNAMGQGQNFMNQGANFGSNYQNIYNRASSPSLDNAIAYATASPQAQSMIDAAMRDNRRRLEEQTLPGIGMAASRSNNTNSSRAGVAQAIAERSFDDRRADVASNIYSDLADQYLRSNSQDIRNMTAANEGLKNTYGIGFGMGPTLANMLTDAGSGFRQDAQAQLDDTRDSFERQRDFDLNQYMRYNAGILNNAPQSATYQPVTANPTTAALGGAMAGFGFGGKYLTGLNDLFSPRQTTPSYNPNPMGTPNGSMYGINNNVYGF